MIPAPKLDDREYADIVSEAVRLIPRYCPEWTNHNPSDPGITLLELAAWMTDIILYRLNRVPEKNYIAFLNLLGITLKPPLAARALLQFELVEGASRQIIPVGTQVATPQAADEETIVFETLRELVITSVKPDRCFSYFNETYSDNTAFMSGERPNGFEAFGGAERVERFLYLSDPRFANCGDSALLRIFIGTPERGARDLARLLEWEFWNGDRWKELMPAMVEVDRGEVAFYGPLTFEKTSVNGVDGLFLRGRLAEVPDNPEDTEIDTLRTRVEVSGEGVPPDRAFANLDNNAFILLDLGKNAFPFGKEPNVDCVLYLACDELLGTPDAEIQIEFSLAEQTAIPKPNPSDDLLLAWEFFDGKKWRLLGRTSPRGIRPGAGDEHGFHDDTNAFTKTGHVSFRRPQDMQALDLNGEPGRWIRVKIEQGDYGVAGTYTLDADKWVFKDDRPLRPPAFKNVAFRYREDYANVRYVMTYNDFAYKDVTELARTEFTIFQPFTPKADESPALYLGFPDKLPNDNLGIYFHMAEDQGASSADDETTVLTGELAQYHAARQAVWEAEQRVEWEYWNGTQWEPLAVKDDTSGFTGSGFIDFVGPEDAQKTMKFTEERFWVRARLEVGGYVRAPRIQRVITNVVEAHNAQTMRNETLGSSDVTPLQTFQLLHGPLLEGEVIEVRERQPPPKEEIEDLGEQAYRPVDPDDEESEEVWVRWKRVDSFFESGPRSRHYSCDYQSGRITFGDGRNGMIPPDGKNNIVARTYQVGGGSAGNVNPGTLTALTRAIAYVDSVNNPLSAGGGADRESVDEAKDRAPFTIKSRDRAVTAEDFEMLALRSSTSLARAKCVADASAGEVKLVLVPKAETEAVDLSRKLMPSNEMLRYVKRYLDERRLVGTMLQVIKPLYKELSVKVTLLRRTVGTNDRIRRDIEDRMRRFLHPLVGGRDGRGWPFGRNVLKSDLLHLVEEVPGVEGVDTLAMYDEQRRVNVEQIRMEDNELPHVVHVHVVEKVRDDIV